MGMEREFNPAAHREEYDKTEQELGRVKADISGEKPKAELDALIAERDRLIADLEEQRGLAQEEAEADKATLDLKRDHIRINTKMIKEHKYGIELCKQKIKDITKEIEEITGKKIQQEREQPDIETIQQSLQPFLSETFKMWSGKDDAQKAKQEVRFAKPDTLDYESLAQDINEQKFGEYTLNPDTQNIDLEKAKVFIPDLSQFVGKPRFEAIKHIIDTYGATHDIPGIEYWKWIIENPDKAPQELKDKTKWVYFPGSVLRDEDGHWLVPHVYWDGDELYRNADWLVNDWRGDERVVLIEKEKQSAEK